MESNEFMSLYNLKYIRDNNVSWKLISGKNAPFIISFLYEEFILHNQREIIEGKIVNNLEAYLNDIGSGAFEKDEDFSTEDKENEKKSGTRMGAMEYLKKWSEEGYLRRFYQNDEKYYDLTPGAQRAIDWVMTLEEKGFIGAESRLNTFFNLLNEIVIGSESNVQVRIQNLKEQRDAINIEIEELESGKIQTLAAFQIKERYREAMDIRRNIIHDFRYVEKNILNNYEKCKKEILTWNGSKGRILNIYFDDGNTIKNTDQGRSMTAFWEFLMSRSAQNQFDILLEKIMENKIVQEIPNYRSLSNIEEDLRNAAERVLHIMAVIDKDIRHYIDNAKEEAEHHRISELINSIECSFVKLKDIPEIKNLRMELGSPNLDIQLPMCRKLFTVSEAAKLDTSELKEADIEVDEYELEKKVLIKKTDLIKNVKKCMEEKNRNFVTLAEVLEKYPLKEHLMDYTKYHELDSAFEIEYDFDNRDTVQLRDKDSIESTRIYFKVK